MSAYGFRLPTLAWRREMRDLLLLAVPLAISQVGLIMMNITDAVMMGRLSAKALAAGGLAGNIGFTLIIVPQGLLMAMQPILSQLRGADDHAPFVRTLSASFCLALACSVPIVLLLLQIDRLLLAVGTAPDLAAMALDYEWGFIWAVPAALWQIVCRFYLASLERPRVIWLTIVVACFANAGMNWLLIYGHWGLPACGLRGSAYATAVSCWGMAATLTLYGFATRLFPPGLLSVRWPALCRGLGELIGLGWAIAGSTLVEIGLFSVSTLLMSRFGPTPLAAHQICLGLSSVTFMVPMAIGQASTVRVGYHIGAGEPRQARQAGFMALGLGVAFMCLAALALKLGAGSIVHLYIDAGDPELPAILQIGSQLIALAALFQIFDGAQVVAAGSLRGLKDTRAALYAAILGYWAIGLSLGVLLAFPLGLGPAGLWWGFFVGLIVVAALLTWRFNRLSSHLLGTFRR
jgi:MATE family multidrug resistance protein